MGSHAPNTSRLPRLLLHGEAMVAPAGMALAAILLIALASAGWWTVHMQRATARSVRLETLETAGRLLSESAEPLMSVGELSVLRRMIVAAGQVNDLNVCRIVLEDGGVVADAEVSKIDVQELPERWAMGPGGAETARWERGIVMMSVPLAVGDRGGAVLELTGRVDYPAWTYWEAQAGLGVVGAMGLGALLVVYRLTRWRLRGLGAIREALLALGKGESAPEALRVDDGLGAEAAAWNALLNERERLRQELLGERAKEMLGARRDVKNDLVQACDAMWQGLILVDERLIVKYANGAAATYLKAKREGMAGQDVSALIADAGVLEAVRAVADGSVRRRTTLELRSEDGEGATVLRFSVRPVRREDTAAAIIMIEDVTQQRVADEARNAFVAQATHELRTPLTNIRLYVEQALENGEEDPEARSTCLNVINQESRRLERIVGDLLSVSEIEAGSIKLRSGDVRLEAMFEELEADYRAQAEEKRVKLGFDLPPKWPVMQGDRDKIVLALHNLIGNAIKYTPSGGGVTVKVEAGAEGLVVEVEDTGIGIREEEAELVFEKFYRAKDQRIAGITGSGLGLALAREVVRLHGGDITLRSQLNQGSTFTLTLPVRAEAA